ncbi:MAG: ComEC/Rec2 family competence protein [Muribaculaceae bacterium]|nr:ComEC/Rec2 family competence protein [Muribaculaceae bacterium]
MTHKFLFPLLGLIAGIWLAADLFPGLYIPAVFLAGALIVWIVVTILSKDPVKSIRFSPLHNLWIFLLFTGVGALDFNIRCSPYIEEELQNKTLTFRGEVKEVEYFANGDRFKLNLRNITDSTGQEIKCRNCNLIVKTDGFIASKGDILSFTARPVKIEKGENKYSSALLHQGILYRVNVKQSNIHPLGHSSSFTTRLNDFRDHLIIHIEKSSLNRSTGDFLISILLGDKLFLSPETRQTLSSAGMAHILALSGMHVAIVLAIVMALLFPLSLLGLGKIRKIIAVAFIWLYVMLTGFSPSTVRAAIMATILVGALLIERKNSSLNALLASVFLIILLNPFLIWDVGLQMSFFCVLAIILFPSKLNPIDHRRHPHLYKVTEMLLVTMIATLFIWALTSYYFGNLPLLFLISNFLLLPLLPLFVGVGAFYILFLSCGLDFHPIASFLDIFHDFFIGSADFLSYNGKANIQISVTLLTVFTWFVAMFFLAYALHTKIKKNRVPMYALASVTLLVSMATILYPAQPSEECSLRFIHSLTKIEVNCLSNKELKSNLSFPRKSVASFSHSDYNILSVDCPLHPDSLTNYKKTRQNIIGKKFLIIGPEADFRQMAELIDAEDYSKVVLHSGVGKNKKAELFSLVDEYYWEKIHSLRDNGSLDFPLN